MIDLSHIDPEKSLINYTTNTYPVVDILPSNYYTAPRVILYDERHNY